MQSKNNRELQLNHCEGCFCNGATWRAEGDHYVSLDLKRGVAEPKIQPRAPSSAQGLMGYFPKIFRSQDHKSPNKIRTRTRRLIKAMLSISSPKNSCWAEPLTVPWLDQA
jgi:hypothetical protein